MFEGVYTHEETIERYRCSWLGEAISEYLVTLAGQRYRKITLQNYARILYHFGAFVERHGMRELSALPDGVAPFISQFNPIRCFQMNWRGIIMCFIRHLTRRGLIPEPKRPESSEPFPDVVSDYLSFLRKNRGGTGDWFKRIQDHCVVFLEFVRAAGATSLSDLTPDVIQDHITSEGQRYTRTTMSGVCSILRNFLRYLYLHGKLQSDLSIIATAPRLYRHERCPRFLTRREIHSVLSTIDRQSPEGLRNYAMLLLLATYGLRGIEVVRLRLDDIDWRNEKFHIRRRKAGNRTTYPLAPSVGDAILSYIERGRPATTYRRVFMVHKAPFNPIARTATIGHVIKKHFTLAGIKVERPGTHTFRYSCAQMLLEKEVPIKTIGDYLGHLKLDSTQRYTMIAIDSLRDVALEELL